MNEEQLLVAQSREGQHAAFDQLVERHQDRLYNSLLRLTGSPHDALDLAQDAFLQAYQKLDTFRGGSAFFTWLYRIAFNLAASQRRRRRGVASLDEVREQFGQEPSADVPDPSERLQQQERAGQVQEALGRLSDQHRAILVLRDVDDLDYETIAQILEIPPGTVRSRLHRARAQLREELLRSCEVDEGPGKGRGAGSE